MFYVYWILLIIVGLGASIATFVWAIRNGQFSDQERARYLPLNDLVSLDSLETTPRRPAEVYALGLILSLGLVAMVSAVVLTIIALG